MGMYFKYLPMANKGAFMIISDILSVKGNAEIISIESSQLLPEAVIKLVDRSVGSLVVMEQGTMVGIITERDIMRIMRSKGCDIKDVKVSEIMSIEPIFGNPNDTVDYVRGVMTENHIRHLPVMDGDTLLGIISFHDVAKACLTEAKFENRLLKRYIRHWPE
jgi:CBS domain-containing protein